MIPQDTESPTFDRALLSPRSFPKRHTVTGYPPDHDHEPQSLELKPNRQEHELDLKLVKSLTRHEQLTDSRASNNQLAIDP